jgi:hypothetical protein
LRLPDCSGLSGKTIEPRHPQFPRLDRSSTVWKLANFENPLFMRVGGPIREGDLKNVVPQYYE